MIDSDTYQRFKDAEARARELGLPLVELLDTRRLLLTPQREHEVVIKTLDDLARRLDRQSAHKLLSYYYGRTEGTADEMLRAINLWLETVCRYATDKTLEEL